MLLTVSLSKKQTNKQTKIKQLGKLRVKSYQLQFSEPYTPIQMCICVLHVKYRCSDTFNSLMTLLALGRLSLVRPLPEKLMFPSSLPPGQSLMRCLSGWEQHESESSLVSGNFRTSLQKREGREREEEGREREGRERGEEGREWR